MDMHVTPTPLVSSQRLRLTLFFFLMTALFMATLDNQIVATALPTIVGEFGEMERFGWIGSAYLLATCAVMPLYGKLGDLFGRKYVMIAAVTIFTLGSIACGLAVSMDTLIAARVLQGLGGGGIMVSIFSINADLFEPRERARYQSYSSLVLMASGAVGPVLGGTMSDLFGWRSIFLINIPIGMAVVAGLLVFLPYRRPTRRPKIDYAGALLLAGAVTCVVLLGDSVQIFGSLLSSGSAVVLAIGAILAIAWVLVEKRAPEPIVPLGLFSHSTFSLMLVISVASGAIGIGMVNYYALFLQTTTGLSPSTAGLMFIMLTGGIVCGSLTAGRLISITGRYKPYSIASAALMATALLLFTQIHPGTPVPAICAIMALHGIGVGFGQQVPIIAVQNIAERGDVGAATGAITLSKMGGASIAISIYGAVIASGLARGPSAIPGVDDIEKLTPLLLSTLPEATRHLVAESYTAAFLPLFLTAFGIALVALVAAVCLKAVRLPQKAVE